ncbi:MAG: hypothetical protein F7B20_02455 [Aeropyrum sp.]|nr:hypothetical protein [Aeropyrum sp.]MCE4615779.1 hypothetical protein [Aeropyrum sp.]
MSERLATAVRVRLVGRRWKVGFLKDLTASLDSLLGGETLVRINSFIAQPSNLPITDIDIFAEKVGSLSEIRRSVEDVLEKHGYPLGRLLTVKQVHTSIATG